MKRIFWNRLKDFWQGIQPRTLRAQIMTLIGVVNLVVLVITTVSVNSYVYRAETNAWHGRQLEAARNAAQSIVSFMQRNEEALRWFNLLGYDEVLDEPDILKTLLDRYPAFLEIVVLDRQGQTIASAAQSKVLLGNLFTTPQAEWFRSAQAGQEYYTRVQISAQDEPYLIFALPIQDSGVIAARINMDVLRQVVAEIHFGQRGSVFVVNQLGQVNAHTDPNIVLTNASMEGSPEFPTMVQAPWHEWYGERWNFSHQRVVSVSTAVGQTGWLVITELPVSEAYAASRLIRVVLPVGMFLLLVATTWIIRRVLTRIFLKSVDILKDGADRIGDGDLRHRMKIPRMDELGEVMAVFNNMAGRLETQHFNLEQRTIELEASQQRYRLLSEQLEGRVNERTAELQQLNTELRTEVNERKRAEERLNVSLQEKDVLLKEIHHRVKNNLQIISSLLNLQSQNVTDARTLDILNDSQNRVRSMVLIHEKLYQSESLAQVNFSEYIRSLVPSLLRSYQRGKGVINIQLDIDDISLPLEQAIPCGLIVNELVTNALKYAFPQECNGTLWIEFHETPVQEYTLRVADNGVGLPTGLDVYHSPTLGLQLVNSLTRQLEGMLELDRQNGTAVQITFRESLMGADRTWFQQES